MKTGLREVACDSSVGAGERQMKRTNGFVLHMNSLDTLL